MSRVSDAVEVTLGRRAHASVQKGDQKGWMKRKDVAAFAGQKPKREKANDLPIDVLHDLRSPGEEDGKRR